MIRYTIWSNTDLLRAQRDDFNYWDPYFYELQDTLSASPFPLRRLDDLAEIGTGITPAKDQYSFEKGPKDAIILKVANLSNSGIRWQDELLSYVSPELFAKSKKAHIQRYDILVLGAAHQRRYIGKRADIVETFPSGYEGNTMCVAELVIVRPNLERINPYYLLATLRSLIVRDLISQLVRGQTGHLYPDDLGQLRVPVPPNIETQKQLARVAMAADHLISKMLAEIHHLQEGVYRQLEDALSGTIREERFAQMVRPAAVTPETYGSFMNLIASVDVETASEFVRIPTLSRRKKNTAQDSLAL
jgi:Type I restriction modification DNA specificity domain